MDADEVDVDMLSLAVKLAVVVVLVAFKYPVMLHVPKASWLVLRSEWSVVQQHRQTRLTSLEYPNRHTGSTRRIQRLNNSRQSWIPCR